jgi:hypothetical protein
VTLAANSGSARAPTAASKAVLDPSSGSIPSRPESSESSTLETLEGPETATPSGSPNTARSSQRIPNDRYDHGLKHGAVRVMNSPAIEHICMENRVLKILVDSLSKQMVDAEKTVKWYRGKLREAYALIVQRARERAGK